MSATTEDYYKVLEIPNTASQTEIRAAYRKLSVRYHPSINPEFQEKFSQLAVAFEKLFTDDIDYIDEDGNHVFRTNDHFFGRY